jgi:sugar phosphate isomerase/epimerase
MNRRTFFIRSSVGLTAAIASGAAAQAADTPSERIGISTWSFHNFFSTTLDDKLPPLSKSWDLREFPEMIADRYHVHQMEMVAPHFESTKLSYLREVKSRLERAHSHLVNIPVDIKELEVKGGLSDPDPKVRETAIAACTKWIDIAKELGAKSVRCDPGEMNRVDLSNTISSYKKLASYAGSKGLYVIIENHGGVGSEHPEDLVKVFKAVGDHCGALPDMGNFPDEATRERGLPLLYPYAPTVSHAKGLEFDEHGVETAFDFPRAMQAAKRAGFQGVYSIEYEGPGDPYTGVQNVVNELMRYL